MVQLADSSATWRSFQIIAAHLTSTTPLHLRANSSPRRAHTTGMSRIFSCLLCVAPPNQLSPAPPVARRQLTCTRLRARPAHPRHQLTCAHPCHWPRAALNHVGRTPGHWPPPVRGPSAPAEPQAAYCRHPLPLSDLPPP